MVYLGLLWPDLQICTWVYYGHSRNCWGQAHLKTWSGLNLTSPTTYYGHDVGGKKLPITTELCIGPGFDDSSIRLTSILAINISSV